MSEEKLREEQLRIMAVGAAISRREWSEVERAYAAIRDEFDRRPKDATTHATLQAKLVEKDAEIVKLAARAAAECAQKHALWDALLPRRPRCRDCGDCNGRCQDVGHSCDPNTHALEIIARLQAERDGC